MRTHTGADIRTSQEKNVRFEALDAPNIIKGEQPLAAGSRDTVLLARSAIRDQMMGTDSRLIVITGPCSIHDPESALEYAERIARLSHEVKDQILIIMRVYFQKPRTSSGWKGLIYDPNLDGSNTINHGIRLARSILLAINRLGVPCATEFLDSFVPHYIDDLIAWAAIGARTVESQVHRELASCLPMPVGIKNSTDGDWQNALNGMICAQQSHATLSINPGGRAVIAHSPGNDDAHIVLRGGKSGPNYSTQNIRSLQAALEKFERERLILVDCSHGNSSKDFRRQPEVFQDVLEQVLGGQNGILGMMIESHLNEGAQAWEPISKLRYGVSITDGCIDWQSTEDLIRRAHELLSREKKLTVKKYAEKV